MVSSCFNLSEMKTDCLKTMARFSLLLSSVRSIVVTHQIVVGELLLTSEKGTSRNTPKGSSRSDSRAGLVMAIQQQSRFRGANENA